MSKESSSPNFGQRIVASRSLRGLSQNWLAQRAGLDPSYVSRIENGKVQPTVPMAQKLAAALGTPLGELLGPAPPKLKNHGCPVSQGGDCLIDLIDPHPEARSGRVVERYTPRQIRLLRAVAALVRESSPELLKGLEAVVRGLLGPSTQKRKQAS